MRKRLLYMIMTVAVLFCAMPVAGAEQELDMEDLVAQHVVLMDYDSGRILLEKSATEQTYPASTTKLMTALLAAEALDLSAVVTISETAADVELDSSNLGFKPGEQLTVEELLYALLVYSANDAANALAEAVSGDIPSFVALMNEKASEWGLSGTHFCNPHGYHDPNHYITAKDLAVLMRRVVQNQTVLKVLSTPVYEMPPTNLQPDKRTLINTNSMITTRREMGYLYEPVKAGKTGYTSDAGHCLAAYAEKDGKRLISVVLNSKMEDGKNESFEDTEQLLRYGFNTYSPQTVVKVSEIVESAPVKWSEAGQAALLSETTLSVMLSDAEMEKGVEKAVALTEELKAPLSKGDVVGTVEYRMDGVPLGTVSLTVAEDVPFSFMTMAGHVCRVVFTNPFFWIGVAALLVLWIVLRAMKRRRRRRTRFNRNNYRARRRY